MIAPRLQRQLSSPFRKRINRAPSPTVALALPWLTIVFGSLSPILPVIASAPVMPPFGFLFLIAWRQLRPGLLPVWAGAPLGAIDDLYSGQPFGSGVLLWSGAMLVLELIDARFPWRNILIDWTVGAVLIVAYLVLAAVLANAAGGHAPLSVILPQLLTSLLIYPLVERLIARFDRMRLVRIRRVH
ncbi:MAG: rod shape-determining protein MreD [Novosphingobium sp.]|nr:rod shape-determining protein MreD [Novosphingobium sp.]